MEIKNKVVLVTGASSGIGKATAELFSKKGAKVVLAARSLEEVKDLAAHLPDSFAVAVDMTKPQEVQNMVEETQAHYGRIDVLINNVAQELPASYTSIGMNDFTNLMAHHVYGPLVAMQSTLPFMKKQGSGAIVNISSGVLQAASIHITSKSPSKAVSLDTKTDSDDDGVSISLVFPRDLAAHGGKRSRDRAIPRVQRKRINKTLPDLTVKVAETIVETVEKGIAVEFR